MTDLICPVPAEADILWLPTIASGANETIPYHSRLKPDDGHSRYATRGRVECGRMPSPEL